MMMSDDARPVARRELLRFVLQSPLLWTAAALAPAVEARPELAVPTGAAEALDVFQMERVAQQKLALPVLHYIASAADDGKTLQANRDAFDAWAIRVRRLVDVSRIGLGTRVLGETLECPVILAPVGNQQSIHPDGELATARAARAAGQLMIASTVTNHSVGAIARASGPLWFQLYASPDHGLMEKLIHDAEAAGCGVLVLTVDSNTRGNREGEAWWARVAGSRTAPLPLGNFTGHSGPPRVGDAALTWDVIDWIRARTPLKLALKGIVTREDAALAVARGVDGLIVSNHGGRQEESLRSTLASLPEVVEAAAGRIPVLVDGGFRRGTDVLKALALGARAALIARPVYWGLSVGGSAGVQHVLELLKAELALDLLLCGLGSPAEVTRDLLAPVGPLGRV